MVRSCEDKVEQGLVKSTKNKLTTIIHEMIKEFGVCN